MKLLTELFEDVELLVEGTGADKKLYIHGPHAQADTVNRNKRNYPKRILENAVEKYKNEYVSKNRALGELNHPQNRLTVDPSLASHRIVELYWSGNDVMGKSLILNTPMGNIIKGLLEGGTQIGVSTRGAGSVSLKEGVTHVGNDFVLATIDAVLDPSAHSAWVDPLMESADWIFDSGVWKIQELENAQRTIKESTSQNLKKNSMEVWEKFVGNLRHIK
jgi:hypothetical protein